MILGEKTIILTAVGNEIRRYIPNAKDYEYNDVVMAERRIQAIDTDPVKKLVGFKDCLFNANLKCL